MSVPFGPLRRTVDRRRCRRRVKVRMAVLMVRSVGYRPLDAKRRPLLSGLALLTLISMLYYLRLALPRLSQREPLRP